MGFTDDTMHKLVKIYSYILMPRSYRLQPTVDNNIILIVYSYSRNFWTPDPKAEYLTIRKTRKCTHLVQTKVPVLE